MQSYFFIPGTLLHKIDNILQHGADEIIIDMEEVQPQENKQKARDNIKQYQEEGRFKNKIVFPRVNDRESGNLLQDVYQLTIPGIAGFMYP